MYIIYIYIYIYILCTLLMYIMYIINIYIMYIINIYIYIMYVIYILCILCILCICNTVIHIHRFIMCQRLTYFDHAQVDQLWVNHTSTAAGAPSVVRNMHREMLLGRQENSWKIMEIWKGQKELGVYGFFEHSSISFNVRIWDAKNWLAMCFFLQYRYRGPEASVFLCILMMDRNKVQT